MLRVAVVGHVEWVLHGRVREAIAPGSILHLTDRFSEPGGGGGVAARALPSLGVDEARFYTALADDEQGRRSAEIMTADGVDCRIAWRSGRQNRCLTMAGADGERTIVVLGQNEHPTLDDDLGWDELAGFDGVFFTGDDPRTLQAARAAGVLVVTARRVDSLRRSGVRADVLVGSASDPSERIDESELPVAPALVARTRGSDGGDYLVSDGAGGSWQAASAPGPIADAYGAGDVFMAALTVALARREAPAAALEWAAAAAASQLTRRGGTPPARGAATMPP